MHQSFRNRRAGFTLVELLVVIGIIAVLISMLLPALGRVRFQAAVTACAAQMRDVTASVIMYANENRGMLPPFAYDYGQPGFSIDATNATWFQNGYQLGASTTAWEGTAGTGDKIDGYGLGRVYRTKYIKSAKVLYCPPATAIPGNPNANYRNFNNYFLNPHIAYRTVGATTYTQLWWKKISNYGKMPQMPVSGRLNAGAIYSTTLPPFKRAIIIDPLYSATTGDMTYVNHSIGNRRAFNMGYVDGSVQSYTASKFAARTVAKWEQFLDLSNALQHAVDGGTIDWQNSSSWNNKVYNFVPFVQ